MTRSAPRETHICWLGGVHEYNPDGRCFVCEEIDKLAEPAPETDEKSKIPDKEVTE